MSKWMEGRCHEAGGLPLSCKDRIRVTSDTASLAGLSPLLTCLCAQHNSPLFSNSLFLTPTSTQMLTLPLV